MRAARKRAGKTQSDVARLLQTSQANVSKLENAMLIPSAPEWFEFCEALRIPVDSLRSGILDRMTPVSLRSEPQEAGFRLPKRYAENRASAVRGLLPVIAYSNETLGEEKMRELVESFGIDPDLLVELSNQLNLNFVLDLFRTLSEKGHLAPNGVELAAAKSLVPVHHGLLEQDYKRSGSPAEMMTTYFRNAELYSGNFLIKLENTRTQEGRALMDVSVAAAPHVKSFNYRNDPVLGDTICRYHQSLFRKLPAFNGGSEAELEHSECHFHGAERCIYKLKLQTA